MLIRHMRLPKEAQAIPTAPAYTQGNIHKARRFVTFCYSIRERFVTFLYSVRKSTYNTYSSHITPAYTQGQTYTQGAQKIQNGVAPIFVTFS